MAAKDRKDEKKVAKRATEERGATRSLRGRASTPSTRAKSTATKATAPRKAGAVKRAVARPVTRIVAPAAPAAPRPKRDEALAARAPKPKAEPRPLPIAPAGEAPVIGADGAAAGTLALPEALIKPKARTGVLFQAVVTSTSNARLGTAATKNRARVAGGGAKPWRQKGTGRARQGSTRAPHWRHGGVAFGPNGRRYQRRIPEKMRREAFAEAFAARAGEGRVLVYEGLTFDGDGPKTKTILGWLGKIGDAGKALFVTPEVDEPTASAAANARETSVRSVGALRTSDLLTHDTVIVRRDAIDALAERARIGVRA